MTSQVTFRKPGPKPRGNNWRLMVYLTDAERDALMALCEADGLSQAEAVRQGLRLLQKRSARRSK